jgi:hypothetical protein
MYAIVFGALVAFAFRRLSFMTKPVVAILALACISFVFCFVWVWLFVDRLEELRNKPLTGKEKRRHKDKYIANLPK